MKPAYVMYDGKRNVVGLAYTIDGQNGKPTLLARIFVSPEQRGKGHARALLNAVTVDADREYKDLYLSVIPDDGIDRDRLVKLYQEFGFKFQDEDAMLRKWRQLPRVTFSNIPAPRRMIRTHRHI